MYGNSIYDSDAMNTKKKGKLDYDLTMGFDPNKKTKKKGKKGKGIGGEHDIMFGGSFGKLK